MMLGNLLANNNSSALELASSNIGIILHLMSQTRWHPVLPQELGLNSYNELGRKVTEAIKKQILIYRCRKADLENQINKRRRQKRINDLEKLREYHTFTVDLIDEVGDMALVISILEENIVDITNSLKQFMSVLARRGGHFCHSHSIPLAHLSFTPLY